MDQSVNIPWTPGMNYGMGVNLLTGDVAGKAIKPIEDKEKEILRPIDAAGQTVSYDLVQINSLEELHSSIGISVEASGRYGLFNGSAKSKYANESKFNSQATFLLAKCVVMNAFTQIEDAQIKEEAKELLNNEKAFHDRYGDGYVRGMQTGGEMFITIAITSSTKETQQSIAAELKAAYGTKPARVEGTAKANVDLSNISSRCELRVSTYQRGGTGQEQALVETLEKAIERLRQFPTQVAANPVPYEVQVASYHTLPLPEGQGPTDIEGRKEQLEKYARLQLKFVSLRNEIEFIQSHPEYFDGLPQSLSTLNEWNEELKTTINDLKRDAAKCANSEQKPSEIESYENKLTTFKNKLSHIERRSDFRLINGRENNASITVNIPNFPLDLPGKNWKHSVIYKDFEATVRLATLFLDPKINSGRGIGLGIFSRAKSKTIAILYIIYPAGTRTDVLWSGSGGPEGGDTAGECSSDVIYLKIRKEGHKFEMFSSLDGLVWKSRKQDDLTDSKYGFGADDPLDVVLTGYSMDGQAISGKFYNLSIEKIAK